MTCTDALIYIIQGNAMNNERINVKIIHKDESCHAKRPLYRYL